MSFYVMWFYIMSFYDMSFYEWKCMATTKITKSGIAGSRNLNNQRGAFFIQLKRSYPDNWRSNNAFSSFYLEVLACLLASE